MIRGKRGQGLSMNMVVVAILAVLILVVIAIVFTGGLTNATQRLRQFFNIGTAGQDLEFAREQCRVACEQAKLSDNPGESRYCKVKLPIRGDDGKVNNINCKDQPISFACDLGPGVVCIS